MKKIIVLIFFMLVAGSLEAQESAYAYNEISFIGEEVGFGARALGMGGAYIGLADDYSSIYWNPAGLGFVRPSQFFVSMSHNKQSNQIGFLSSTKENETTKTTFGAIGMAYAVNTVRGSLVFAGGYNKVHNYNTLFSYGAVQPSLSFVGEYFEEPYAPFDLFQSETVEITGGLNQYSFGVSMEVGAGILVGGTFNFWSGNNDYNQVFTESDESDLYFEYPNDFDLYYLDTNINTEIKGYDLKLGLMWQRTKNMRIGLILNTPRMVNLTEEWSFNDDLRFDDGAIDDLYEDDDEGTFAYKIRMPFMFGAGASYKFPNVLVSADFSYMDWTQLLYRDETPFESAPKSEANRNIKSTLSSVFYPKIGFEFTQKAIPVILRAGYGLYPSPIKDLETSRDQTVLSFGFGYDFGTGSRFDLALRRSTWEVSAINPLSATLVTEDYTDTRIFASMVFNVKN